MKTKTIAEVAAEYLWENGLNGVMWGDTWSIHEIAKRAGKDYEGHPSRTWKAIMAALNRSLLFEKKVCQTGPTCEILCFEGSCQLTAVSVQIGSADKSSVYWF